MELHHPPDLTLAPAVERYLARLPLSYEQHDALAAAATEAGEGAREQLQAVHAALASSDSPLADPVYGSIRARFALGFGATRAGRHAVLKRDVHGRARLETTPPLNRASMAPQAWPRVWWRRLVSDRDREGTGHEAWASRHAGAEREVASPETPRRFVHVAFRRRLALATLTIAQTWVATDSMTAVLPYHGRQPLEIAILVLFAILFGWISVGFWTAMAGFALLAFGGDRYAITRRTTKAPIPEDARTAIIMPICNEDVARVFAGLRATYESLERTRQAARFDFFILSDSSRAETRTAEIGAWMTLCDAIDGFGRVFYRWRQHRIKRKSGNVADFCRRWGSNYRYMVVLDADSVMTGDCLTALVCLAEANPNAGIIQTAPRAAGRDTLYARMQQFATGVYGPLFTAGLHYWQLGESHYWGHNAIIRIAPFMRHCALGRLPGKGALSGEILSHDFVEAALMRRAGWEVWIAYDLPGSYEEMPPNLIDELSRDRRWCQGNLMNFRLFLMKGLHPAHRAVFMTGVMAYLSAPLWFLFLILSTALVAVHTLSPPEYFVKPYQLFPLWPEWRPEWALALVTATAVLLFVPKLLAALVIVQRGATGYGGQLKLFLSIALESLCSALLAPIRMLFHTRFVLTALLGRSVRWKSPPREDAETTWTEALKRHGLQTVIGTAWAAGVWWLDPSYLGWLLPVVGALIISIPLSVYTSRVAPGRRLRRRRYFLIPEESHPPWVMRATRRYAKYARASLDVEGAIVDPLANALASANGIARTERP